MKIYKNDTRFMRSLLRIGNISRIDVDITYPKKEYKI